jgi:hypothetical protein
VKQGERTNFIEIAQAQLTANLLSIICQDEKGQRKKDRDRDRVKEKNSNREGIDMPIMCNGRTYLHFKFPGD